MKPAPPVTSTRTAADATVAGDGDEGALAGEGPGSGRHRAPPRRAGSGDRSDPRAGDRRLRPAVEGPPRRRAGGGRGRDGVPVDAPPGPALAAATAPARGGRRVRHRPQPLARPCRRRPTGGPQPPPRPPARARHDGAQHLDVAAGGDPLGEPPDGRARRGDVRRDRGDGGEPARGLRRARRDPRARHRHRAHRGSAGRRARASSGESSGCAPTSW